MPDNWKEKWEKIRELRSGIGILQYIASCRDSEKGLDIRHQYNGWFLERCKSLALYLNGRCKREIKDAGAASSLSKMLELFAISLSDYEPEADLRASGRILFGRTSVAQDHRPSVEVSGALHGSSPLRPFILGHELVHLAIHLPIPPAVLEKSERRTDRVGDGASLFEEFFDDTPVFFASDEAAFSTLEDLVQYIEVNRCDAKAAAFQKRREEIFRELSAKNIRRYYREVAADLTSAFLPVANFADLRERLPAEIRWPLQTFASKFDDPSDEVKCLMHALDYATTVHSHHSNDAKLVEEAAGIFGALLQVALETRWFSPLQVLLGASALVNFKSQPRLFPEAAIGEDFLQEVNLAFYGAVGVDVSRAFGEHSLG